MKIIESFLKLIDFFTKLIMGVGIIGGVIVSFINIVARFFNIALPWASELTIYLFLWSAFFGAAYNFKENAHIGVTILQEKLPSKLKRVVAFISYIVIFIFLSAVAYFGYKYILLEIELEEISTDLHVPMWIVYLAIPLSFGIGAIYTLENMVKLILAKDDALVIKDETKVVLEEFNFKEE